MRMNLKKICDDKMVTRDDGEKLNRIIRSKWDTARSFSLDFDNILVASVSFMDEAFGKLALKYSKDDLLKKLKFENITKYDRALINDIMLSRFRQKEAAPHVTSRKKRQVAR